MRGLLIFFILYSRMALAAPVPPVPTGGALDAGFTMRGFKDIGPLTLMAEGAGAGETDQRQFRQVTAGSYYQLSEHWSAGAFYRRAYGLHHDDDWISQGGAWQWQDTNSRGEDFLILDTTAKALLEFLPGKNWAAEFKTRLNGDLFNGEQTLMLRPGLTYFWLREGAAYFNFFLQFEFDVPLNFAERAPNERWIYAGALYRVTSKIDIGGFAASHWEQWQTSQAYINKHGAPYKVSASNTELMGLLIFH